MTKNTSYITFARKYRPGNFAELHGQEVLIKILSHAILNNRLAQGYLLTGIRGVGKTTSARIIAKTINCTALIIEGVNIRPCEQCSNCASFNNHNHPDILEIDAASRTSVDDIRQIIESTEYRPLIGKYKVFIIDEVHMLSKGAFNALLKTLEEPPPHIIFIFATTEVQKIPLTIISRCQRYDLRRLTFDEILKLIKQIAEKENLKFDIEALKIIAAQSEGSARDAIFMLDQASSLVNNEFGNNITETAINQMLGLVATSTIVKFIQYIIDKKINQAIELVGELYITSANLEIFIELASEFIAYLSKAKMLPNHNNPLYEPFNNQITEILSNISFSQLSVLWQIYSKGIVDIKTSRNQLIETEMLVIKSIYCQTIPTLEELTDIEGTEGPQKIEPVYKITDFLKFLHQNNQIEMYYLLLNEVEVKSFINSKLEIEGNNINLKIKEEMIAHLFAWTQQKWDVIITKKLEIITLKDQLIQKIKSNKDWKMLIEHFPDLTISDILLKT